MVKKSLVTVVLLFMVSFSVFAEGVSVKGIAIVQGTKNSAPGDNSPLAASETRGELLVSNKTNLGTGLFHIRMKNNMQGQLSTYLRQLKITVPVSIATLTLGRWYEKYTPAKYFGRYLLEANSRGNGSFCTNYTIVNGIKTAIRVIESAKTDVELGFLPQSTAWDNDYILAAISSNPIEALKFNIGADIQVARPDTLSKINRLSGTVYYAIMKDLSAYAEVGIVDLSAASDNMWILGGLSIPTGGFMNLLNAEIEYKKDRLGAGADGDLAWMLIAMKQVSVLKLYLNIGADPRGVASTKPSEIGMHFRVRYDIKK